MDGEFDYDETVDVLTNAEDKGKRRLDRTFLIGV
jgi:hypothetical protein